MRACQPVHTDYVERRGVKLHYEVFGAGDPTVLFGPRLPVRRRRRGLRLTLPAVRALRGLHSGQMGDSVTWC